MVRSRVATAAVGVVGSLALSVLLWWYTGSLLVFLFVPFVPFLFGTSGSAERTLACPACGFRTTNPGYEYCPRDGRKLE